MQKFNLENSTLLVVDDQKNNLKLLYDILQQQGFQVFVAKTGVHALEIAQQGELDLCLLDINMPEMNGYEVCRKLKKSPNTAKIPIIFLSVLGETKDKLRGFFAGGVDYITKPFQAQEVLARVNTHLSLSYSKRALEENEVRLKKAYEELETKVIVRTRELQYANVQLQELARMKDDFLANISHELRTPLNAILGNAEVLLEGVYGFVEPNQVHALNRIQNSGEHLLSLINSILDLAKARAGNLELHMSQVPVQQLCQECIAQVKDIVQKKQLHISSHFDPRVPYIFVDPQRFKQILLNLISNAVKFTPEAGEIGLECEVQANKQQVCFKVWDTGIGISLDMMDKLFQPFVQIDASLSRAYEGSGLGLGLVKSLVDLHGGSIRVNSELNNGSCFTVCLPWYSQLAESDSSHTYDKQLEIDKLERGQTDEETLPSAKKQCILLAEDNELNRMMLAEYLVAKGYKVITANDGVEAIRQAHKQQPALILMDIQMPEMDGLQAIKHLRAKAEFSGVPIIALTALAMPNDEKRCLAAGATMYLSKPVVLQDLLKHIMYLLHKFEAVDTE